MIPEGGIRASKITLVDLDGDGGFRLEAEGAVVLEVRRSGDGWVARGAATGEGHWRLGRAGDASGGLVLLGGDGAKPEEIGRTTPLEGARGSGSDATVLVADGRLFRAGFRTGARPMFQLTGWEVPGAYLTAENVGSGWVIRRTPAGEALEDDAAVVALFAATLADPRGRPGSEET